MSRIGPVLYVVDVHFLPESIGDGGTHGGYELHKSIAKPINRQVRCSQISLPEGQLGKG